MKAKLISLFVFACLSIAAATGAPFGVFSPAALAAPIFFIKQTGRRAGWGYLQVSDLSRSV